MTVITDSEIRSPRNGRVPRLDSPAAPASARARIPVTVSNRNRVAAVRRAARTWWVWTARPVSLRVLWRLSAIDTTRIPARSGALRALWLVSNWTDRLVMFALIAAAPTCATGALRWTATRPTRRWAFYLTTTAVAVAYLLGRS